MLLIKEVSQGVACGRALECSATRAGDEDMETAAQSLRLRLLRPEVRTPSDLEPVLEVATRERADALITMPNPLLRLDSGARKRIVDFAVKRRIPTMHEGKRGCRRSHVLRSR